MLPGMENDAFHPQRNALARAQDGLLTAAQLTGDIGLNPDTITAWTRSARIRRWHRGVYSDATLPETWRRWLMADLLFLGDDAVVTGPAAAGLWGLAGFDRTQRRDLVVPRTHVPRVPGAVVRGVKDLRAEEVTRIGGLRVTTVTSTLQSLSRFRVPPAAVLRAAADGVRRGRTSSREIARFLVTRSNERGNRALRFALDHLDEQFARCRSVGEVDGHDFLRRWGFGGYVVNDRVRLPCGRVVEFDVLFVELRKAIEWDSDQHHGSPLEVARDEQRDAATRAAGYDTSRIRINELRDEPALAAKLRDFLAD